MSLSLHNRMDSQEATHPDTLTAVEIAILDGAVAGTQAASKAVVPDSNVNLGTTKVTAIHLGTSGSETEVTATGAEINSAAVVSARHVNIGDNDTYTLLATNSGKTHTIPQITGDIAIAMPTPAAGLEYLVVSAAATAEGDDWIFTATSDFAGGLAQVDTDGSSAAVLASGSSTNTCTIVAPLAGTGIRFICDGTNWLVSGFVLAIAVPTFTDV